MENANGAYDIDRGDLSDRVYQVLRKEILSGKFAPGQHLSLEEFAQYFRVSITPVRDALRLLAADGLVELYPRRGAYVSQPSATLAEEIYQIRQIVECAAIDWAIQRGEPFLRQLRELVKEIAETNVGESHQDYLAYIRLDERFHQSIVNCIENAKLSEIYSGLRSHTLVTIALYSAPDQRASGTLHEHEAILEALERGDAQSARAALHSHLENAKREILQKITASSVQVQ